MKNVNCVKKMYSIVLITLAAVLAFFPVKTFAASGRPEVKKYVYAQDGHLYLADAENTKAEAIELDGVYAM